MGAKTQERSEEEPAKTSELREISELTKRIEILETKTNKIGKELLGRDWDTSENFNPLGEDGISIKKNMSQMLVILLVSLIGFGFFMVSLYGLQKTLEERVSVMSSDVRILYLGCQNFSHVNRENLTHLDGSEKGDKDRNGQLFPTNFFSLIEEIGDEVVEIYRQELISFYDIFCFNAVIIAESFIEVWKNFLTEVGKITTAKVVAVLIPIFTFPFVMVAFNNLLYFLGFM
jgi:hypothetical protein